MKNLTTTNGATITLYAIWDVGYVTLPTPTRANYKLEGWYTAPSGGVKVGDGGAKYYPSATCTIYAQWTPDLITVTFFKNF